MTYNVLGVWRGIDNQFRFFIVEASHGQTRRANCEFQTAPLPKNIPLITVETSRFHSLTSPWRKGLGIEKRETWGKPANAWFHY